MNSETYQAIHDAFVEGWNSYETACCAFNDAETAWDKSAAKANADAAMLKGGAK